MSGETCAENHATTDLFLREGVWYCVWCGLPYEPAELDRLEKRE